jgi:hypothetical protein
MDMTPDQVNERLELAVGRLENKIDRLENKMESRFNQQRYLLVIAIVTPLLQILNSWIHH